MHTPPIKKTDRTFVLLGEAPGADEEREGRPFVGASGQLLRNTLFPQAGLDIDEWHITNVFQRRPPENNLKAWTANKTEHRALGLAPRGAPIDKRYLLPEYWPQVERTIALLEQLEPDIIIAFGGKAQWLLSNDDRIGMFRGAFFQSPYGQVLSTFHPAAVLREFKMLPVATMDLIKVRLHLEGKLAPPMKRRIWHDPTMLEIAQVYSRFATQPHRPLGVDIETAPAIDQITTISFSFPEEGICIPLWDRHAPEGKENYWSLEDEVRAWRWIDRFAKLPNPKVLQNGLYDMQYLLDAPLPIRLSGQIEDTSILQHAYQPELRKDLGSLASFYLNEPSWKQMRQSAKEAKADD